MIPLESGHETAGSGTSWHMAAGLSATGCNVSHWSPAQHPVAERSGILDRFGTASTFSPAVGSPEFHPTRRREKPHIRTVGPVTTSVHVVRRGLQPGDTMRP